MDGTIIGKFLAKWVYNKLYNEVIILKISICKVIYTLHVSLFYI